MVTYRLLQRNELPAIWTIDRSEFIERIFVLEGGELMPRELNILVPGWPAGQPEREAPQFLAAFDEGAWFLGAWDGPVLAGVAILDTKPVASQASALQLKFLHVSRPYRGTGVGVELFERARREAGVRGARTMYISATESEHTVRFYLARGCRVNPAPDPELFALEPEDIHLLVNTSDSAISITDGQSGSRV